MSEFPAPPIGAHFDEGGIPSFFPPRPEKTPNPASLAKAFGLDKIAYRIPVALDLLSISRATFYALAKAHRIQIVKVGRRSIVYATDLAKLLDEMRRDGGIPSRPRRRCGEPRPTP